MKTKAIAGFFLFFPFYCFSQWLTNVGTDFQIAFPPNVNPTASATLQIFISSNFTTSGSISSAYPGVNQLFNVTPGIVTQITVPSDVALFDSVENKGIRITSLEPISVYGINRKTASADAYLALPTSSLGVDYRVLTYETNLSASGSSFSIVATQNGTVLTIFNHQTDDTSNVSLKEGQTYIVKDSTIGEDLTGSRIQSNYPVAVFGSLKHVDVPSGCIFADHIVEQMFPISAWSKRFITVPLAGRDASGDIFRLLANYDGTDVTINGTLVSTLNSGEYYETDLAGYNSIITSKPTLVAQYAKGLVCSGTITGDPFMMLIPPREQFLTNYTISSVPGFASHWVNIVAPYDAVGAIYQDGVLIPSGSFVQVGTTGFYGTQISIIEGSHTFTSTFPFGVFVYGWIEGASYGYPGGTSLCPIGSVDSVTISPDTASGILNVSTVCFTVHVEDDLLNPVAGVLVNFNISGINPITGTIPTNASGNAQYCYTQTGTVSGVDQVYAEVCGFTSSTSTVNWTYLPPCSNPTDGGSIGNSQTECGSYTPVPIASLVLPTGQTGTLEYKWQQSTIDGSSGFNDIPGSNSVGYAPGIITQTTWYRRLARVDCMSDWTGAASSNVIEMTVIPLVTPEVTIAASDNSICQGTSVTFTATPVNGGNSPSYQWKVNGFNVGTNSPTYSYLPSNNDLVSCILTSSQPCSSNNPATSNTVTMIVNENLPAGVIINANPNPFCQGTPVTFGATPVNGGTAPSYQWKVNGANSGTDSPCLIYSPQAGDSVWCLMTSNLACVTGNPATSNKITMVEAPSPVVTFSRCFDSITTVNAKPFQLKGGLPLGGIYSGPGVNSTTGVFTPSVAGTGTKNIIYSYTNVYLCSANNITTITVQSSPPFTCGNNLTDIRDGKVYRTIQVGSKCWMGANLNYGSWIHSSTHQRDNCIPEKYCPHDLAVNCQMGTAAYQWDELIQYGITSAPDYQGVCPPGWHIPSAADFQELIDANQGNGLAGTFLTDLYLIPRGFEALLQGMAYLNTAWAFTSTDFPSGTMFWTSTPGSNNKIITRGVNNRNQSVSLYESSKANALPVRCVRD